VPLFQIKYVADVSHKLACRSCGAGRAVKRKEMAIQGKECNWPKGKEEPSQVPVGSFFLFSFKFLFHLSFNLKRNFDFQASV
jgi:hypothetical protein